MEARQVTVRYADKTVLDRFSLTLPDGGLFYLMGPSGRGKTTLLRVMAGLLKPDGGTVELPGRPVMLFQEDRLFPGLPALAQVEAVLPREKRGEAERYLSLVELDEAAGELPEKLSGGMARRLALARALAVEGEVYLLDEPFAGVDLPRALRILERLKALPVPVLLVSHESDILARADSVIDLDGPPLHTVGQNGKGPLAKGG